MRMPASPFRFARSFVWAAAFVLGTPGFGWALNPTVLKLTLPPSLLAQEGNFGDSVALNDTYVAVGDSVSNAIAVGAGAVHLFDARTGRYLRRLAPSTLTASSNFGRCLAISGNILAVGAPNQQPAGNNHGTVYLFDLRTGQLIHELVDVPNLNKAWNLGTSVAISGRWVAAGAPNYQVGANSGQGAVFIFDAISGDLVHTLVANDGAQTDNLGESVAISGPIAVGGAHSHDGSGTTSGAAYAFDVLSGAQLQKLVASDAAAGFEFGKAVAVAGNTAWIGAYGSTTGTGAVYQFDLTQGGATATEMRKLVPTDGANNDQFSRGLAVSPWLGAVNSRRHDAHGTGTNSGAVYLIDPATGAKLAKIARTTNGSSAVALCGNTVAVAGADEEDRNGDAYGAVYVFRPVAGFLPLTSRATLGGPAPQADPALFRAFGNAFINADENVAFHGILTSNRGRDQGIWSDVGDSAAGLLSLKAKSGDALDTWATGNSAPGAILAGLKPAVMNQDDQGIFEGTLAGPGINRSNRSALYSFDGGGNYHELLRTGKPLLLNGEAPALFQEFVQNRGTGATGLFSLAYLLQRGVAGVDLTTDSGALLHGNSSFDLEREVAREGQPVPVFGGGIYRQFLGRTAMMHDSIYSFPAYWLPTGETLPVQGLFADTAAGPGGDFARQGGNTTGWPGRSLGTFLAESMSTGGWHLYRATMTGPDVNRTNNEGIWHGNFGSVVAKGEVGGGIDGLPDGTIVKILSFWPVRDENTLDAAIVLLQLGGPGIRRTNDIVLMLLEDGQEAQVLLREGQPVADCDAPAIAAIQRVDVDPVNGHYVILASLTGNRAKNQALFTGNAAAGDPTTRRILRSPTLRLRKGTLYSAADSVVTGLRSLNLSPTTDRGGAGGKGRGQVINDSGQIAVTLQFDNRAVELMTGRP